MILKHSLLKYDLFCTHHIVCRTTQFLWDVKNFMHEKKDQQSNNNFILLIYETKFITQ